MTQEHANILLDFVNSVDAELDLHSASRSLNHEKKILKDLNNKLSTLIDVNFQDFGTNFSRHMEVWTNSLFTKVPIK